MTTSSTISPLAILATGGSYLRSVEASIDEGTSWCSLPDLPNIIYFHTQSGLIACGGGNYNSNSCLTFSNGVWNQSHALISDRSYHSAWSSPQGVVLIGGVDGSNGIGAAEILNDGGQSAEIFPLKYEVYDPCAIQLDDQVILTGGVVKLDGNTFILSLVNAYSNQGLIEDETLPNLRQGRYHHGCGHYVNSDNVLVYLVTGGFNYDKNVLSSTEILISGEDTWVETGKLPTPTALLNGVSFNNKIIMTGGIDERFNKCTDVLSYNIISGYWHLIGNMRHGRDAHAVSLVNVTDIVNFCQR